MKLEDRKHDYFPYWCNFSEQQALPLFLEPIGSRNDIVYTHCFLPVRLPEKRSFLFHDRAKRYFYHLPPSKQISYFPYHFTIKAGTRVVNLRPHILIQNNPAQRNLNQLKKPLLLWERTSIRRRHQMLLAFPKLPRSATYHHSPWVRQLLRRQERKLLNERINPQDLIHCKLTSMTHTGSLYYTNPNRVYTSSN